MKCPKCGYSFAKTERKIEVRREDKRKFVLANLKLFEMEDWHSILRKARSKLGYSENTVNTDILYGLKLIYNFVKKERLS